MSEINKTRNYDMFKIDPRYERIDQKLLSALKKSIQNHNLLEHRPICVSKNMEVLDGYHRLRAAKELNLEVFFHVYEETEANDIISLSPNQKEWEPADYQNYRKKQNKEFLCQK